MLSALPLRATLGTFQAGVPVMRIHREFLHLPFALLLTGADLPAAAQASPQASVATFLVSDDPSFFNGGLLIARGGRPIVQQVVGYSDLASRTPNTAQSVFQMASAAKPFTSVAVLQLRDRGLLRLDDPVARHVPGFPYPAITIRHLLTHTSGLPDLELFEPLVAKEPSHVVTGANLVPALIAWQRPVRFHPGEQFRYSNINYQLLARLVTMVSGQPFPQYVRDRIFRPAGMRSSYVLGARAIGPHRPPVTNHVLAVMYRSEPEDVRKLDYSDKVMMRPYRYEGLNLGSTIGDQNLFSTVDDLVRFDAALRSGKILSLKSQAEAYAPVRLNNGTDYAEPGIYDLYASTCSYGMGWEVCRHPTRGRLVGHAGYNRGIATIFYRELDSGLAAAMFDNADTADFPKKFASAVNVAHGEAPLALDRRRSAARDYGETLLEQGPTAALLRLNRLRGDPDHWIVTKSGLNRLGYDLLHNGHAALALEPFRVNVLLNPDDANVYDSYGEALAANGRKAEAILAYKRSLELKPDNDKGKAALKALQAK
jgi:CubicO group peptidase (beta-lactamase class C family)